MAPGLTRAHRLCVGLAVALLLLVGASRPNAATPDLSPSGWGPGTLVPITLGPGAVTGVLWTAYLVGGLAVLLGLRAGVGALRTWALPLGLGALALLTAPFGSGDHLNYLAYGRILVGGGNPWVESPIDWAGGADPVTSRVEAPWTTEPSVYGPFGALLHGLAALLGGDSLRQGVWVWQVLVVVAWLGVRWVLRRVLDPSAHGRVDVLWTLNPLVFGVGVLGAHIDLIAAALAVVAVGVVVARPGVVGAVLGGGVVALAGSTKFTYAVVGAGIVAAWWLVGLRGGGLVRRVVALGGGFVLVAGVLHAWAGPHVYDQLMRSRQAVSLATPWRPLLEWGRDVWGNEQTRVAISLGAAVLAVLLAWCLLRLSRPAARPWRDLLADGGTDAVAPPSDAVAPVALWVTACLSLAFSLAAPYSLPWYDLLVWAALPALLPGLVDLVALVRLTALSIAYVPGRVLGMTPQVEELTLGVRREVVPWVGVALWVLVIVAGVRSGSALRRGPRRAGT
ncbi:MAG TPA: hypothetical protein PLX57_00365 [Ornithinibacter sp.]|uniref:hypothetical protein n=1 Tax=Ornithinibacter sp. TaxID=2862748 RepID=UPI002C988DF2|nr:hypothetical protein [Ornithinibacter sp.]HQV81539.1 hypothetical protein [Ornithinibacter sp.]HQX86075.1 hypothetical protein [Ornithinibacter sp.]HQZ08670.1 hypothetical protein [Ornithinibacter sp.]HRA25041.1 hypothetical protein [Ornithinibacter sp.]